MAPTDFSKSHDLIVVGAGAAGLAAAARARELGLSTLLLEAKDRIGGRCFTDTSSLGLPWDQGAHWMHQARSNPLVAAAQRLGHTWLEQPRKVRHWLTTESRWATKEEETDIGLYIAACYQAIEAAGRERQDSSVAQVLPPHPRWRPYAEGWLQALNGCEVEKISVHDYRRYREDDANWPLDRGYGTHWQRSVNRQYSIRGDLHRLVGFGNLGHTRGEAFAPDSSSALPTPVLARLTSSRRSFQGKAMGGQRFLGRHEKLALRFDETVLPDEKHWYFHRVHSRRAALNGICRPFGRPMILLHLGGSLLSDWGINSAAQALDPALDFLEEMLDRPLRTQLAGWRATDWAGDPLIGGSYSSALPGAAGAREELAAPAIASLRAKSAQSGPMAPFMSAPQRPPPPEVQASLKLKAQA